MRSKIGPVPNTFFKQVTILVCIINSIYKRQLHCSGLLAAASGEIPNVLVWSKKLFLHASGMTVQGKATIASYD